MIEDCRDQVSKECQGEIARRSVHQAIEQITRQYKQDMTKQEQKHQKQSQTTCGVVSFLRTEAPQEFSKHTLTQNARFS